MIIAIAAVDVKTEMLTWAKGHEQDPRKKESLIALLAKIAAIITVGAVVEGGKTTVSSPGA